ncbi:glutamic acid-rich protein [Drosophila ficusphila]|uniref:glutamic acid-rich protein n=1 Tax=Drosophila ficusphila TaxID=30025 RepID=UPI0007E7AF0D|nr:glutamic acid-rich protein [Drosophila ficusphila]
MEKYPRAREFLGQLCQNDQVMSQFEEEIKKKNEMSVEENEIRPKMVELMLDLHLAKLGAANMETNGETLDKASTLMQNVHFQAMRIEQQLDEVGLPDIATNAMKLKQEQAQAKLALLLEQSAEEEQQQATLESRNIVKEFRLEMDSKKEEENKLIDVKEELDQVNQELESTSKEMTDNLNKKIVAVIQLSKRITNLHTQLKQNAIDGYVKQRLNKNEVFATKPTMLASQPPPTQLLVNLSNGSGTSLYSAKDFFSNIILTKAKQDKNKSKDSKDETDPPLRSILVQRKRKNSDPFPISSTKRVRFGSEEVRVIDFESEEESYFSDSEMLKMPEEESEESEDLKEQESEEESVGDSEQEVDEDSNVEFETDSEEQGTEFNGLEDEPKVENVLEISDPEQERSQHKLVSGSPKSGSDGNDSNGETSEEDKAKEDKIGEKVAAELEQQKTTAIETQQLASKRERPEIISVDIISNIQNMTLTDIDNIPSTSKGVRNHYTSSQLNKYVTFVDDNKAPEIKKLKLDDEMFPTTQPLPDLFKKPSTAWKENEDESLQFENNDSQSLQFASPECEMSDDYLLNFSDNDNDDGSAGGPYIL